MPDLSDGQLGATHLWSQTASQSDAEKSRNYSAAAPPLRRWLSAGCETTARSCCNHWSSGTLKSGIENGDMTMCLSLWRCCKDGTRWHHWYKMEWSWRWELAGPLHGCHWPPAGCKIPAAHSVGTSGMESARSLHLSPRTPFWFSAYTP